MSSTTRVSQLLGDAGKARRTGLWRGLCCRAGTLGGDGEQRAGQGFRLPAARTGAALPRCMGMSGVLGCGPAATRPTARSVPALPYPDAVNPGAALVSLNESHRDGEGIFRLFCRVA